MANLCKLQRSAEFFSLSKSSVVLICCQYPYVPANSTLVRSVRAVPDLCLLKFGAQFLLHGKDNRSFNFYAYIGAQQNAQSDPHLKSCTKREIIIHFYPLSAHTLTSMSLVYITDWDRSLKNHGFPSPSWQLEYRPHPLTGGLSISSAAVSLTVEVVTYELWWNEVSECNM